MYRMYFDRELCYRALCARDPRFDGVFFIAVLTTRVYCRPICPVRTAKLEHCLFFPSAAAAQEAGFRPCLRCRPEIAPDLPGSLGTSRTIRRAMALITEGALDEADIESFAERLGMGSRHLRRLFLRHVGASPRAVAQTHRLLLAKKLLDETALPITEVAFAAGFRSIRRFNTVMRTSYGRTPRELRCQQQATPALVPGCVTLKLPFRPPYPWHAVMQYLTPRVTPGVEALSARDYRRTFALNDHHGLIDVWPVVGHHHLLVAISFPDVTALAGIVARLRRLFDLDANPTVIAAHLGEDPRLAAAVSAHPGLRVVGAWDGFEVAVRAVLGQQVSVKTATTLMGRLVVAYGEPLLVAPTGTATVGLSHVFPRPAVLAEADVTQVGIPRQQARAIAALAAAAAEQLDFFQAFVNLDDAVETLCRLPGIDNWAAQHIALRVLQEPDAFPASDHRLRRALAAGASFPTVAQLEQIAERWRPWRAYAAMYLWTMETTPPTMEETLHEPLH